MVKKIVVCILIAGITLGCVSCVNYCHECITYRNTLEYTLDEIDNGVYGYYNAVTSNIPSENYEMIVLCLNGQIYTLKGDVNIHYTDDEPRLIWNERKIVNGDTYEVYVPSGTIEMRPNIGVS